MVLVGSPDGNLEVVVLWDAVSVTDDNYISTLVMS